MQTTPWESPDHPSKDAVDVPAYLGTWFPFLWQTGMATWSQLFLFFLIRKIKQNRQTNKKLHGFVHAATRFSNKLEENLAFVSAPTSMEKSSLPNTKPIMIIPVKEQLRNI